MVIFYGTKTELINAIRGFAEDMAGAHDQYGVGVAFRTVLGYTMLSNVFDAFVVKSRGGTDDLGITWPALAPATIAARKVGAKDVKSDKSIAQRKKIVDREFKRLLPRFLLTLPQKEARAAAKRRANAIATKATGATKIETLGQRQVEILRDTGRLGNSLTPGSLAGSGISTTYSPPSLDQIFEVEEEGLIVIGTDRPFAWVHQNGTKKVPRRQFLPDDETGIPDEWVLDLEDAATRFTADALKFVLERQGSR